MIDETKLSNLDPTTFENLVFDLVRSSGLVNVNWRTPGADGGRDIEGEITDDDFSGEARLRKWLIECKRYKSTINWPTVWEKVAYADSGRADFLLMVTNSKFSTRCLDEIEKWNRSHRRPQIRIWPGHELAYRLFLQPAISTKYGLLQSRLSAQDVASLALHVARMTQSALASQKAIGPNRQLQASSDLAALLYARSSDIKISGTFRLSKAKSKDSLPDCINGLGIDDVSAFDWIGFVAYLSCLYVVHNARMDVSRRSRTEIVLTCAKPFTNKTIDTPLLREIAFWASLAVVAEGESLCLMHQTLN